MPTILSDESYQRLRPTIEGPSNDAPSHVDMPRTNNWQLVRVTGAAEVCADVTKTYYPAVVEIWNAEDEAATDLEPVWMLDRNDGTLENGVSYMAVQSGSLDICDDERPVFVTTEGTGGPYDVTCEVDGTVTVAKA